MIGITKNRIPWLKQKRLLSHIDFLFIDHKKDLYTADLEIIENNQMLKPGSFVIADNIIIPGAPEYLKRM